MSIHKIQQFTFLYGTIHLGRQQSKWGRGVSIASGCRHEGGGWIKRLQTSKIHDYPGAKNPRRKIRNSFFPHVSIGQMPICCRQGEGEYQKS